MPYNEQASFDDFASLARLNGTQLINQLNQCQLVYDKWQSFRAGRSNADIATAESVDETWIAELDAVFAAFSMMKAYFENGVPSQSDYKYAVMKFV